MTEQNKKIVLSAINDTIGSRLTESQSIALIKFSYTHPLLHPDGIDPEYVKANLDSIIEDFRVALGVYLYG